MKIVIQRAKKAKVEVSEKIVGQIDSGLLLLVCMEQSDEPAALEKAALKVRNLRIFEDENGRMNKSIIDVKGSILAVSQFTLSWDGRKGNRPSFDLSMEPSKANEMFEQFCGILREEINVETGEFGADMQVHLVNDGPVTFSLSF
jgi:D-tyrosyl-tRNA(Tyr) deacylase